MSKKLDQIKDRKARLVAQLADLNEEEKMTKENNQKRYEKHIVRAFRNNGLLSHEEALILNEINQMAIRLNGGSSMLDKNEFSNYDGENMETNNGW